jgi:MEMO1 family protein
MAAGRLVLAAMVLASIGVRAFASPAPVRRPAVAGSFYPASPAAATAVAHYLRRMASDAPGLPGRPHALVLPHAGWPFSGIAAAAGLRGLGPGDFDRVVVIAPNHSGAVLGFAIEDVVAYETPLGKVPLCDAAATLRKAQAAAPAQDAVAGEHSIEVLLPLLQSALGPFCLLPVLVGSLDENAERTLAERLAALVDERTLVVASADFVHYGRRYDFTPFGPLREAAERVEALDDRAIALVASRDAPGLRAFFKETGHNACGRHALLVLLELLGRTAPESRATLLARYASNDLLFVRDESSVGYATLAFTPVAGPQPSTPLGVPPPLATVDLASWRVSDAIGESLRRVARAAIETELLGGAALDGALRALGQGPELQRRQAVFVSLFRSGPPGIPLQRRLRGCRGQPEAELPLDLGVVQAALDAALRDERFPKLRRDELRDLQVEVTLLSPLRPVDSPESYRFGQDGLALTKGEKSAIFLPQVWKEAGWSREEALAELAAKAFLPRDGWRDATLLAFEGQAFAEGHGGASEP